MEYQNFSADTESYEDIRSTVLEQARLAGLNPHDPIVKELENRAIESIKTAEVHRQTFREQPYYRGLTFETAYLPRYNEVVFQLTHGVSGNSSGWMSESDLKHAMDAWLFEQGLSDAADTWMSKVAGYYAVQMENRIALLGEQYTYKVHKTAKDSNRLEVAITDISNGLVLNVECDATGFYEKFLPWFYEQIQNS